MKLLNFPLLVAFGALFLQAETGSAQPAKNSIRIDHFKPTPIRITLEDLPRPFASKSVRQSPKIAPIPKKPVLQAPKGFAINVFAEKVKFARWLALTPEGDVLCASSRTNKIFLFKDTNKDGVADKRYVFLDKSNGANLPFGMAFAKDSFFLGNTDAVIRFPYKKGQTKIKGKGKKITDLPGLGYNQHWTRNVIVSPNGKKLYVSVGSKSNVSVEKPPRAAVLEMNLDGSQRKVFAFGLRNPVGLAFHPKTGELYTNVNERDKLGDDLVPDYFTRVERGHFYGWPYAYLAPKFVDPRRTKNGKSERPDLVKKTTTPDVLYQAHSAALGLTFYDGKTFPKEYRGGAFSAFRGSWNRSKGTGYKIVHVPFDDKGRPMGYYEDFVKGFLTQPKVPLTWGRPVGVVGARDGSLLFTEEMNGRIYRVQYTKKGNRD